MKKDLQQEMIILVPSPYDKMLPRSNLFNLVMDIIGGEDQLSRICDTHREKFPGSPPKEIVIKLRYTFRGIPIRII